MSHDDLQAERERLKRQIAQLLEQRSESDAENAEVRDLLEKLQLLTEHYDEKLTETETELMQAAAKLAEAAAQIAELKRELFGPKADRLTAEQQEQLARLNADLEAEAQRTGVASDGVLDEEHEAGIKEKRPRPVRRVRHPLPSHLEIETVTIEPEITPCPGCGKMPERIGEEISEEIDYIPARLIRRRTVRPKYACRCGEAGVSIAALPPRLIPQSRLGLGLAVYVALARYDDHLSFYRLEQQFRERHGIVIPRQQMVQWAEHIATWLRPLYDAMWGEMIAEGYLQVDETPVKVLDPEVQGKAARGYLWFYAVPGGDVILEFDRSRGLVPVRNRLANFTGTIQTDAYDVYQSLQRKETHIRRIGCLAHARRYILKAVQENLAAAVWFIEQIRALYRIEAEIRDLPPPQRYEHRLQHAPAIWETMKARADQLKPLVLPQSTFGRGLNYFINEYEALKGYLRDGRYEIDNNLIENSIRPTAIGRKRWLFIGHPEAAWRSAVIYSILVSCRRRGINPLEYMNDVLGRLPGAKTSDIQKLLPANWKPQYINTS
jgi:transposase